jgi:hypothetical protein
MSTKKRLTKAGRKGLIRAYNEIGGGGRKLAGEIDFGVRLSTLEKSRYQQYKKYEFDDACNIINIQ